MSYLMSLGLILAIIVVLIVVWAVGYYSQDLPDYEQLLDYRPSIVTRVHAGDGRLLAEFAREKRVFVPVEFIPDLVKQAFISAEDKTFYSHHGIDLFGIATAVITNFKNAGSGRPLVGASTITQQVAKNFLLSNEQRLERKIREILLALKMENVMSKDHLLELYLNEIFLGSGAYGVGAAAQEYFDKALPELEIHEVAYLATLPKAPSRLQIEKNYDLVLDRRNWVINRMYENGYISEEEARNAKEKQLERAAVKRTSRVAAPYFAEEVRRELQSRYGEDILYHGGLSVRTTVDPKLQEIATDVLRRGLLAYERRQDYPGPLMSFETTRNWQEQILEVKKPVGMLSNWMLAVVLNFEGEIGLENGLTAFVEEQDWAWMSGKMPPRSVIMVEPREATLKDGTVKTYHDLRWVPKAQGALIAMDPHTGRILSMQGGWSTRISSFNRATQANRQPGSAFKPFVYLTALENGFTPATLVLDAPFVMDQGPGQKKWRPQNYSGEYYGLTPIRVGIEKSKNLMTVRLADYVGMDKVSSKADLFGIAENMKPFLSYSLGAGETTLLKLASAYAMLVNGGKQVTPTMIDRIQDRYGKTIYKHDARLCDLCGDLLPWQEDVLVPALPNDRMQIADPRHVYQIVTMMEGVVQRGTATRLRQLGVPVAGKTGTTNETRDAWFVGFTPDLVVGVFVGFDEPTPLGKKETGSSVAAPIFKNFMEQALKDVVPTPFRMPSGVRMVQINADTGTRAQPGDERVIWEAFVTGTEPSDDIFILDGEGISKMPAATLNKDGGYGSPGSSTLTGTGGIY